MTASDTPGSGVGFLAAIVADSRRLIGPRSGAVTPSLDGPIGIGEVHETSVLEPIAAAARTREAARKTATEPPLAPCSSRPQRPVFSRVADEVPNSTQPQRQTERNSTRSGLAAVEASRKGAETANVDSVGAAERLGVEFKDDQREGRRKLDLSQPQLTPGFRPDSAPAFTSASQGDRLAAATAPRKLEASGDPGEVRESHSTPEPGWHHPNQRLEERFESRSPQSTDRTPADTTERMQLQPPSTSQPIPTADRGEPIAPPNPPSPRSAEHFQVGVSTPANPSAGSRAVHIGQLEIHVEAPPPNPRERIRAPVRLNGSSLASRLYLRKT